MATHDYHIANADGATVRADLNSLGGAIATLNAGPTAPPVTFPHMWWFDESTNTLKQRNAANTAWVTVGQKVGNVWTQPASTFRSGQVIQEVVESNMNTDQAGLTSFGDSSLFATITPLFDNSVIEVSVDVARITVFRVSGSLRDRRAHIVIRNETNAVDIGGVYTVGRVMTDASNLTDNSDWGGQLRARYTVNSLAARTFRLRFRVEDANLNAQLTGLKTMVLREIRQ